METTKLFKILILLISLSLNACAKLDTWTFKHYEIIQIKNEKNNLKNLPKIPVLDNKFKNGKICCHYDFLHQLSFFLNRDEKKKLEASVFYALNKSKDFEVVSWKSKKNDVEGKIRIFFTMPTEHNRYCRFYQNIIRKGKKIRIANFKSCRARDHRTTWKFSSGVNNTTSNAIYY